MCGLSAEMIISLWYAGAVGGRKLLHEVEVSPLLPVGSSHTTLDREEPRDFGISCILCTY